MLLVIRSLRAARDLEEIWDYLADNAGVARADAFLDQLEQRIAVLADFPEMGYQCNELAPGLRALTLGSHVVLMLLRRE